MQSMSDALGPGDKVTSDMGRREASSTWIAERHPPQNSIVVQDPQLARWWNHAFKGSDKKGVTWDQAVSSTELHHGAVSST